MVIDNHVSTGEFRMALPISQTLQIVASHQNPIQGWSDIVSVCRANCPPMPWHTLPNPEIERDIHTATTWLSEETELLSGATGVYLGLDTLNMEDGDGRNVELGVSNACDTNRDDIDWVDDLLEPRSSHLIRGLQTLHQVYAQEHWRNAFDICDYIFFLGYSGIVFSGAFAKFSPRRTMLVVWGFHDGDLFVLGRRTTDAFTRLTPSI